MIPSATHLVIIPSYNSGPRVVDTVAEACRAWVPVWVVVDGSTDGTGELLGHMEAEDAGLRVLPLPRNKGKGAAVLHALRLADGEGFTHALVMDADGQHPAPSIPCFMAASVASPGAMILGVPRFGADAPALRVRGRRVSNWWAGLETLWEGVEDSLFGFRVYPVRPLLRIMARTRWMRRYDFDAEAAVRLCWLGTGIVNLPAAVRYLRADEGGVSHFRYGRDNALLTWMHVRLMLGFLGRLPVLLARRKRTR